MSANKHSHNYHIPLCLAYTQEKTHDDEANRKYSEWKKGKTLLNTTT